MADKKRAANIELLRIVAMAMVVVMHFLKETALLPGSDVAVMGKPLLAVNYLAFFLEGFCIVAVNAYVLISGYFGVESKWKPSKLLQMLCQIWFYTLLLWLVLKSLGVSVLTDTLGIYGLVQYIFPIGTEHYWFLTSYFYLLLFMPILNPAIKGMTKKQLTVVLLGILFVFCGVKSFCPIPLSTDKFGYDVIWFVCVYLTGAWFAKGGEEIVVFMKKKAFPLYLGSSLLIGIMSVVLYYMTGRISGLAYYFTVPYHYNFLLCLTGAVGLFFVFRSLSLKEGKATNFIRKVGKYSLGVYLFHEHLDIRHQWYPFISGKWKLGGNESVFKMLLAMTVSLLVIYAVGIFIEIVRTWLFDIIGKCLKKTGLFRMVEKIDRIGGGME